MIHIEQWKIFLLQLKISGVEYSLLSWAYVLWHSFSQKSAFGSHSGCLNQASRTESTGLPIQLPALHVMPAPTNDSESTQVAMPFTQLLLIQIQFNNNHSEIISTNITQEDWGITNPSPKGPYLFGSGRWQRAVNVLQGSVRGIGLQWGSFSAKAECAGWH